MTATDESRIIENKMLRRILVVTSRDRIINRDIGKQMGTCQRRILRRNSVVGSCINDTRKQHSTKDNDIYKQLQRNKGVTLEEMD